MYCHHFFGDNYDLIKIDRQIVYQNELDRTAAEYLLTLALLIQNNARQSTVPNCAAIGRIFAEKQGTGYSNDFQNPALV